MSKVKLFCFVLILFLIIFLFDIYNIIVITWTSFALKILFYSYFSFSCLNLLYLTKVIIYLVCSNQNRKFYLYPLFLKISIIFWILIIIISFINLKKYGEFWKDCPYLIFDLNYTKNLERRCILYNINKNSRYTFQYLCSFNSSKDFYHSNKNLIKKKENNQIICLKSKNPIENNYNITLFYGIFKEKYYCSRTNLPKDFTFIKKKIVEKKNLF